MVVGTVAVAMFGKPSRSVCSRVDKCCISSISCRTKRRKVDIFQRSPHLRVQFAKLLVAEGCLGARQIMTWFVQLCLALQCAYKHVAFTT